MFVAVPGAPPVAMPFASPAVAPYGSLAVAPGPPPTTVPGALRAVPPSVLPALLRVVACAGGRQVGRKNSRHDRGCGVSTAAHVVWGVFHAAGHTVWVAFLRLRPPGSRACSCWPAWTAVPTAALAIHAAVPAA